MIIKNGCLLLLAACAAQAVYATQGATIAGQPGQRLLPVWGGAISAIHTNNDLTVKTLIGEDGGRIRYTLNNGIQPSDWAYAATPDNFNGTVLGFDEYSSNFVLACGRGGNVIYSEDQGQTWKNYGVPVLDPCGDPATVWDIEVVSPKEVIAVGLWTAVRTTNSGQNWQPLDLRDQGVNYTGPIVAQDEFHFYSIDSVRKDKQHQIVISAQWEPAGSKTTGVVFDPPGLIRHPS